MVRSGRLVGCEVDGVTEYLGIPYAQPPIGRQRFRPPEPVSPWSGTRAATKYGSAALQHVFPSPGGIPPMRVGPVSEDCLYLNVWVPTVAATASRPVLVWLHGGGLFSGSSCEPIYQGARLAVAADAVVVSVNYRLGVLGGFIRLSDVGDPRLADGQDLGLLDLLLALDWVKENAEAFGGDPGCVTIIGQSAGGHLVGALLASPLARGMFHRAVLQSPQRLYFHDAAHADLVTDAFESAFDGSLSEELYTAATERVLAAQDLVLRQLLHTEVGVPFMCSLHPRILPHQLLQPAGKGNIADVPLLVGTTVDETQVLFPTGSSPVEERRRFESCVRAMLPEVSDATRASFWDAYAAHPVEPAMPKPPNPSAWFTADYMLRVPAERLLIAQSAYQPQVYSYLFNAESRAGLGSFHLLDVPYLFGTTDEADWQDHIEPRHDAILTATMQQAWSSFARYGIPSADSLPEWPAFR